MENNEKSILKAQFLESFPYFRDKPGELVDDIIRHSALVDVEDDTLLVREGQKCSALSFHLSGDKRVYKTNDRGREITLYEVGRGEICIITASCILSDQPVPVYAKSLTSLELLDIEAHRFAELVDKYHALRTFVFSSINFMIGDIIELIDEVVFGKMDARLLDYLIKKSENGLLCATHQMIADDLGTAREVVSRLLKELERKGQVSVSRNHIRLNKI